MRAWYNPSNKAWLFERLPERLRDAFEWRASERVPDGHIFAEDDRQAPVEIRDFRLPNSLPLLWTTPRLLLKGGGEL